MAAALAVTGCGPSILNEESSAAETQEPESSVIESMNESEAESPAAEAESTQDAVAAEPAAEAPVEETPAAEEAAGEEAAEPEGGKALSIVIGTNMFYEYDEATGKQICSVTYPSVSLSDGDKALYPNLVTALEGKNGKYRRDAESSFETLKNEVRQYENISDETFGGYTDEKTFSVIRADDTVLSLGGLGWTFTGGAHPLYTYVSLNLDPETGRELSVRDIATDPVALIDKVKEVLAAQHPGLEENLTDSADMVSEGIVDQMAWTLGYDSFTMRFGAGQIDATAAGPVIVSVPLAGNEALFNEKYLAVPESYGVELIDNYTDLDADGDGDLEHLELVPLYDEESGDFSCIATMKITLDENTTEDTGLQAFEFRPYIVHTFGKTFLYVQYGLIDDVSETAVFDLTGGTPVPVGRLPYRTYHTYTQDAEGNGTDCRYAYSDPEAAVLGMRSEVLGTNSAYAYVHTGEDGLPVVDDGIYLVRMVLNNPMTLKQEIEGDQIDPATKEVTGKITLPAGLTVDPYRTDQQTFVEIKTEDGNIVRFAYTPGFPSYVNGIDTQEVFENIMYAG